MAFPKISFLAILLCFRFVATYSSSNGTNLTSLFQHSLSSGSQILLPSEADYTLETTQRWTVYEAPTYVASIKPALASDVQAIIKIASAHNIPFLATGGGHGLSITLHNIQNGIEIDLSFFKGVTVNADANTMTIGGANTFGDAIDPLFDAGKEIPTGSCSCVGFVGGTIGGGVGRLQGLHGLIVDNLLSVQLVTAAGDIITASETENSDLFWGIRGAGVDFGIILWATFRVEDHTNGGKVFNADFIFPASANRTHFELLKGFESNMPAELSFLTDVNWDEKYNGTNILFNAVYFGSEADGMSLIQPFIDNGPIVQNISTIPWNELISVSLFGLFGDSQCVKGRHVNSYAMGLKTMDLPSMEQHFANFSALYDQYPNARSSTWFIEGLALQAVESAPENTTSFPDNHRTFTNQLLWGYNYNDSTIDVPINAFAQNARAVFSEVSGYPELEVYVSYAHGDEGPEAWFADNVARLTALKKIWDPQNLFSYMNPITTGGK